MGDLERERWAHLIDGLVTGEYVELLCPDVRRAKHAQQTCIVILRQIGLPFDAGRSINDMWVRVCGMIRFLPNTSPGAHYLGRRSR